MPNIFDPLFDEPREHPGFVCRRARIGRQAGAERLGASVWDVPLRTPEGWRELAAGEAVSFPDGGGLRELYRRGDGVDYYEGEEPPPPA